MSLLSNEKPIYGLRVSLAKTLQLFLNGVFTPLKTEYSFQFASDSDLHKFWRFKKMYNHAQSMLDEIKDDLKEFYQTNPPRYRKERRERAKVLKRKIERFNSYCKDRGIEISSK